MAVIVMLAFTVVSDVCSQWFMRLTPATILSMRNSITPDETYVEAVTKWRLWLHHKRHHMWSLQLTSDEHYIPKGPAQIAACVDYQGYVWIIYSTVHSRNTFGKAHLLYHQHRLCGSCSEGRWNNIVKGMRLTGLPDWSCSCCPHFTAYIQQWLSSQKAELDTTATLKVTSATLYGPNKGWQQFKGNLASQCVVSSKLFGLTTLHMLQWM